MDQNSMQKNNLAIPIAIVIAGALIAGALFFGNKGGNLGTANNDQQAGAKPAPNVDVAKVKTTGEAYIGSMDAPVTMAYWFDYQCPICKSFDAEVMPTLVKNYVDTGKLRIVFKDFEFLGDYSKIPGRDDSKTAATVAKAVWEASPAKFFAWHKAMFEAQDAENTGWGSKDDVLALTKTTLGAEDYNKVVSLLASKTDEYQKSIAANRKEASTFGINGTPSTITNKTLIVGVNLDGISQVIDEALGNKK